MNNGAVKVKPRSQKLPAGVILSLDPKRVKPFSDNPRKRFRGIKQLAESIRLIGQVTPIVVTRSRENGYDAELVDGERRLRACLTGKMPVKAVVDGDDKVADRYVRSVAANFCRQGHDAVEIMEAILALSASGRSTAEIAGIFGKADTWVRQYTYLQRLAPEVLEQLKVAGDEARLTKREKRRRGSMTLSVALLLVPLKPRRQIRAMRAIMRRKMGMAEARTYVHKLAKSSGARVGVHTGPREKFRAIASAVENCYHVLQRYLDMPGRQIRPMIRGAPAEERERIAAKLESLCESLLMLADEIAKS